MKHLHFKELPSTQLKAIELIEEHNSILISAQKQTQGRGRRDNSWEDLENSLAFSFNISPTGKPTLLALEIAITLANYFDEDNLSLKWPNDIYNEKGKKVIGILVNKEGDDYIIGIGINYGPVTKSTHNNYGQLKSGHLLNEEEYKTLPEQIYKYICENRLNDHDIISKWSRLSFHINQKCKVIDGDEIITGTFEGIGEYGEALIKNGDKIEKAYTGSLLLD
ncbi:biotin--[acetyl-CoA-carboxylase] ligase [Halobacteriovorax sp. YZS-1-1]|uniref:biotin--[acetyl-CoA-carboxylase] ligase n=1 Tax=unclassified Halobacteriovorax TaxID=2639665 RepID=UPI00399C2005